MSLSSKFLGSVSKKVSKIKGYGAGYYYGRKHAGKPFYEGALSGYTKARKRKLGIKSVKSRKEKVRKQILALMGISGLAGAYFGYNRGIRNDEDYQIRKLAKQLKKNKNKE